MSVATKKKAKEPKKSRQVLVATGVVLLFFIVACAAEKVPSATGKTTEGQIAHQTDKEAFIPVGHWGSVIQRLQAEDLADAQVVQFFENLPPYSAEPMGTKMKELFKIAFMQDPTPPAKAPVPVTRMYKGFVSQKTIFACQEFLKTYASSFASMEKKYGVSKYVVVALLYVETRHGEFLGNENAFWVLASMAASNEPAKVTSALRDIPITQEHDSWLRGKLVERSDWAYDELKALIIHCKENQLNPHTIPGSMYGAIGLCQFMPSNISRLAVDGNNDGIIDLFTPEDAIHSVGKYLEQTGWKANLSTAQERRVLRRYNNSTVYANTILGLATSTRTGVVQTGPPDAPKAKTSVKKVPAKKSPGAKQPVKKS